MASDSCVYLGQATGRKHQEHEVYECQVNRECVQQKCEQIACCDGCKRRLLLNTHGFSSKWEDPLFITDRCRDQTHSLRNMLAGSSVVLACGGPSANLENLSQLNQRGIWTMAVNNMAGHAKFRPQAFIAADGMDKFSSSIWLDPGIMKFFPTPKFHRHRNSLRIKSADGSFEKMEKRVNVCPNIWSFKRRAWLVPDDSYFLTDDAAWGNHDAGVARTGQPKTVCTMLLAIRLLRYLGASTVFLVGVDFYMTPDYGYSFAQARTEEASVGNNAQFAVVNGWLCEMQQKRVFERFGMKLFNCCKASGLRAFPYVSFNEAIEMCRGLVEIEPSLDCWYDEREKTDKGK